MLKLDDCELDINKLKTLPVDLSKLSSVVKNDVVNKTAYNKLVKKVIAIQTIDSKKNIPKLQYKRNLSNVSQV